MPEVKIPHVPFGPKGVPQIEADANYYREAARNIRFHAERGTGVAKFAGSNLTEAVARLCEAAAEALEGLDVPVCEKMDLHEVMSGQYERECGLPLVTLQSGTLGCETHG